VVWLRAAFAVVLAKARTHYPNRVLQRRAANPQPSPNWIRWLWVLAFARTTAESLARVRPRNHGVVPAKAGTHTPQQELLREIGVGSRRQTGSCGYGSRPSPGRRRCLTHQRGRITAPVGWAKARSAVPTISLR